MNFNLKAAGTLFSRAKQVEIEEFVERKIVLFCF